MKTKYIFEWTDQAFNQLEKLKKQKSDLDNKYLVRLTSILESLQENPFKGIGKPEPLRYNFPSCWSRRINHKDRIIYKVEGKTIVIISILGLYKD